MNPLCHAKLSLALTIIKNEKGARWSDLQKEEYRKQVISLLEGVESDLTDIALAISGKVREE